MSYSLSTSTLLAAAFSLTLIGPTLADYIQWRGGGGGSCIDTCNRASTPTSIKEAVVSGQYKNLPAQDQSFTVCMADAKAQSANRGYGEEGEGKRIGFNIVSSGARCRVAHGDEGLYLEKYECLCLEKNTASADQLSWNAAGGGSCIDACKRLNLEPVKGGQYKNLPSEDQSFTVCRANAGNEGSRVGFNIVSSGARCRVAHGDDGIAFQAYDCLCLGKTQ